MHTQPTIPSRSAFLPYSRGGALYISGGDAGLCFLPRAKREGGKKKLRGTKNVTRGQERYIDIVHRSFFAKRQHVLGARAGQTRLHQTRRALGDDDFVVRRNVVAVRVRNESEMFRIPRVEPQVVRGQINAALITNFEHNKNYARIDGEPNCLARKRL